MHMASLISRTPRTVLASTIRIGGVQVRVYRRRKGTALAPSVLVCVRARTHCAQKPLIFYIHGGGFVFGRLGMYDRVCGQLADECDAVVISIDAGGTLCVAVARHARAAGVSVKVRRRRRLAPKCVQGQLLIYPLTQFVDTRTSSALMCAELFAGSGLLSSRVLAMVLSNKHVAASVRQLAVVKQRLARPNLDVNANNNDENNNPSNMTTGGDTATEYEGKDSLAVEFCAHQLHSLL
ncbi:unnamed protein product [Sphagnum balticum]